MAEALDKNDTKFNGGEVVEEYKTLQPELSTMVITFVEKMVVSSKPPKRLLS
ncbi:hypothetical protein SAMN04487936_110137 [Halobacillus dabanensis]|uniref:Uncharacterized protein n=1 Tax=Halobacillus dabanensis TaxID=240302 RepID=A0A1I3YBR4_HALDA|nr:hypothetical protein [Halobacillus dabanensis]SFK29180.1 hypothetical protein SAMN04487936_110137 [Halobacillus dabanensis]